MKNARTRQHGGRRALLAALALAVWTALSGAGALSASAAGTTTLVFPVKNGCKIAQYYGYSKSYFNSEEFHAGIDILATGDKNIYAAAAGQVVATTNGCSHLSGYYNAECAKMGHHDTYGNHVKIKGNDGRYYIYGHLEKNSLVVKTGQKVAAGQKLGRMGSSGAAIGTHLHFEVRTSNGRTKINTNPVSGKYSYHGKTFNYKNGPYSITGTKEKSPIVNGKTYYIKAGVGSKSLYLSCSQKKNFGNVCLSSTRSASSRWKAVAYNGAWLFRNEYTGRYMDIYGNTVRSGANLQVYSRNNHESQQFIVQSTENKGYYYIKSICADICVDCYGDKNWKSGTNVWVYRETDSAKAVSKSQMFQFIQA